MKKLFYLIVAVLLVLPNLALASPISTDEVVGQEHHIVDTSIAFGTINLSNAFGDPVQMVVAGTELSSDLVSKVLTHPIFPDTYDPLLQPFGSLNNYDFLTLDLTNLGNAGSQLKNQADLLLQNLIAANPDTVVSASFPTAANFLETESFQLFGGVIDQTIITGTTNIDFYEFNGSISGLTQIPPQAPNPAPEPTAMLLLGTGLAGLVGCGMRRKN